MFPDSTSLYCWLAREHCAGSCAAGGQLLAEHPLLQAAARCCSTLPHPRSAAPCPGCASKQVLYLDVRPGEGLERLTALAAAARAHFAGAGLLLQADRAFVPHGGRA